LLSLNKKKATLIFRVAFFSLFSFYFFPGLISPATADNYEQQLLEQAEKQKLWINPNWLALGLYRDGLLNSKNYTSIVDDPRFFLSTDGQTNPEAELKATIKALFNPGKEQTKGLTRGCMFQGRYLWLKKELQINEELIPSISCPEFDKWYSTLDPESISLIFPEAYLNNPASMFGHTLLRINAKGQNEKTRLLAYSASYGAIDTDPPGFIYAMKGLFGFYSGVFAVSPYYETVRKYSDLEHRDIWEYELNLKPYEIEMLVKHLWELRGIRSDYYYFTENCAILLLSLLDTARPSLKLQDEFDGLWAIPSETVREITSREGLVKETTFRPSSTTKIKWMLSNLSKKNALTAKDISKNGLNKQLDFKTQQQETHTDQTKAKILETAFELLSYKKKEFEMLPEQRGRALSLLQARSALETKSKFPEIPTPKIRPDQGHLSGKLAVSGGFLDNRSFYEIRLRPAYHDTLDTQGGYRLGSQLIVFDVFARHSESEGFNLEQFSLLDLASFTARDEFFKPTSWRFKTGLSRVRPKEEKDFLAGETRLGVGHTYALGETSYLYALGEAALFNSPDFKHNHAVGFGGSLGFSFDFTKRLRSIIEAKILRYSLGQQFTEKELLIQSRYSLSSRFNLKASAQNKNRIESNDWEFNLGLESYF